MLQKLGRHDRADGVATQIFGSGAAASIAEEPGDRVGSARFQFATQHVSLDHAFSIAGCHAVGVNELVIPTTIDDVDDAWISDVLRRAGTTTGWASIIGRTQVGEGVGIMGQLFKLNLAHTNGDGPDSLIIKLPSPFDENRAQGVALGMYEAEVRFYNELAGSTSSRTPKSYYARIRPGTADFVCVLEDLSDMEMADEVAGMSLAQAEAAVGALAQLHASWWGRVAADEFDWLPGLDHPRIAAVSAVYPMLWQGFLAKFADVLPDGASEAGDLIAPRWGELMAHFAKRPMTLLHMDFRCENMFFGSPLGAETVTIFDWQAMGRGPAAYDLAYLLGGSLPTDVRRQHQGALLDRYHAALVADGVSGYSRDELTTDFHYASMLVTATPIFTGATLDLANERGKALIGGMGRRLFSAVVDHDATALMP